MGMNLQLKQGCVAAPLISAQSQQFTFDVPAVGFRLLAEYSPK